MTCTRCGCPGALPLLVTVICPNPACRFYDEKRCEWDHARDTVNGARLEDVHRFLVDQKVGGV